MTKISDIYGKTFGPKNTDLERISPQQEIFDPGSHESKLQEARTIPITTVHNGNGKDKDQENKKKVHLVQKHSESDMIAEAVIVAGIPYFAIAKANSNQITLEKSITIDDINEYRPFEKIAYLTKPYVFKSKQDFEACVNKARKENLDTLYRKVK